MVSLHFYWIVGTGLYGMACMAYDMTLGSFVDYRVCWLGGMAVWRKSVLSLFLFLLLLFDLV